MIFVEHSDVIAMLSTGTYGYVMASNYNAIRVHNVLLKQRSI